MALEELRIGIVSLWRQQNLAGHSHRNMKHAPTFLRRSVHVAAATQQVMSINSGSKLVRHAVGGNL